MEFFFNSSVFYINVQQFKIYLNALISTMAYRQQLLAISIYQRTERKAV